MDNPHTTLCDRSAKTHHSICDFIFKNEKVDYFGQCQVRLSIYYPLYVWDSMFRITVLETMKGRWQCVELTVRPTRVSVMPMEWAWQLTILECAVIFLQVPVSGNIIL